MESNENSIIFADPAGQQWAIQKVGDHNAAMTAADHRMWGQMLGYLQEGCPRVEVGGGGTAQESWVGEVPEVVLRELEHDGMRPPAVAAGA